MTRTLRQPAGLEPLPHQRAAITAAITHLTSSGDRASVVMPCGTGKTLVATLVAASVAPSGPTLVTVPTLALLEQTCREWTANSPVPFTPLALCSETEMADPDYAGLMVPATTDPHLLSRWMRDAAEPVVVFATYHSTPQVAFGQEQGWFPGWSLIVADEAHRTVTGAGSAFATVLDEHRVRADKRLFLTATPRTRTVDGKLLSMSNERVYGPIVYRLGLREAIDARLLASYEVVVAVVTDDDVQTLLDSPKVMVEILGGGQRRLSEVAKQVALARVAADRDINSAMVFHNSIRASEQFADTFGQVARVAEPGSRRWSAHHVDGYSDRADRHEALRALGGPGRTVVSNVRVFTEGLDVPSLDAVMFADPRTSQVDVAQAVGRALRINRAAPERIATVILPVILADGDDQSGYGPVCAALQALMEADPALEVSLREMSARQTQGQNPRHSPCDGGVPVTVCAPPQLARTLFAALATVSGPPLADHRWEHNAALLADYVAEHGKLPESSTSYHGIRLGRWCGHQRQMHALGQLTAERTTALEAIAGWAWTASDARFNVGFDYLLRWFAVYGNLHPPRGATIDDFRVGAWWHARRREHLAGSLPHLHRLRLEALPGWTWEPAIHEFERGLHLLHRWISAHNDLVDLDDSVWFDGFALGAWWTARRAAYFGGRMPAQQAAQIAAATAGLLPPGPYPDGSVRAAG